jgi:hypothetical protein
MFKSPLNFSKIVRGEDVKLIIKLERPNYLRVHLINYEIINNYVQRNYLRVHLINYKVVNNYVQRNYLRYYL